MPPYLRKFDWILLASVLGLTMFGLAAIYSTSLGAGGDVPDYGVFSRQLVFLAVGLAAAFVIPAIDYRLLSGLSRALYALSIVLLVAVLLFGSTVRGARSWFGFGGFGIQPVEVVKICMVVFLAKFFSDYARHPGGIKQIVGSGSSLSVIVLLVLMQPDFGSAFLLLSMWGGVLLISGIRRTHLLVMVLTALTIAVISWAFILKPYQKDRVAVFWDPAKDPSGKGYNVTQSLIAIGSGGVFGKGLGFGSQSQLRFLPERQTDFVFAVVAEELGFVGVILMGILFASFFYRGFRLASDSRDDFTMFLVIGMMVSVGVEVFVNVGGATRLMPVTGVTLPFVSYGGSSLIAKFAMVGILQSIAVRRS